MANFFHGRTTIIAAALAAVVPLAGCARGQAPGAPENNPVKTVKDYLIQAVLDHNGYNACAFLTLRGQREARQRAGGPQCRQAFDVAALRLGGQAVDTVHAIDHLAARAVVRGDRASVLLTRDGDSVRFGLAKANRVERNQFLAPDSGWRIAKGGLQVIPPERPAPQLALRQEKD